MPLLDAPPVTTESFRKLAQFNEQRQKPTLVPLDPAHIPIQVIKDSQRRQELFDVIFPHDPSNDPHTVVTLSTEPFPRSPRSPPEAKAPGTSDDSNANDLSHCAITISDAGARHALCSIVGEADRPPKPIDVYPVLVHCFLFLPFDQRTLFAISHTCRAWRLASAQLPQWSLLPSLCYAFDEKAPHNVLPLTEHFADHADVELAKNASSRDEVMHFAKATKEAFTALNIDVDEGPASTTEAFVSALHFTVLSLTAAGVAGFLIIAWAIGTAYGIFTSDALIVFGYLAGATMLYSVCVPMIINPYNDCQFQPHNPRVAERFTIAHSPFLVLLAVTAFTLGTPMSLISARVAVAKDLERGPQLFYGPTTDACRLDMTSRPIYVHITDLSLWRVSPTPYAGSSAARPAGCPSTTSPSWWVDTFLSYSGNWSDFTCFDNPVGDVSVVYLIPPTSGICNEAGPIAVPFLPTSDSFRDTITTTWGAARHSTNPMWFRATVSSYWFDVEGNSFARTWYDNVNSTWTAHFNDTSIVPSKVSQIPLMTLGAVLPPDELVSKWQFRMLIPIVLAVVCFACTVLAICVSWVRVSSFATDIFSLVLAILALSPLLCISMGVYCHVTQDVDTCYMGEKGGLVLIIAGLVVLGLGACAGGVYAGWRRWSK